MGSINFRGRFVWSSLRIIVLVLIKEVLSNRIIGRLRSSLIVSLIGEISNCWDKGSFKFRTDSSDFAIKSANRGCFEDCLGLTFGGVFNLDGSFLNIVYGAVCFGSTVF